MPERLLNLLAKFRGPFQLGLDLVVWLAAIYAATWLRFEFDLSKWNHTNLWIAFGIAAAGQLLVGSMSGLYRRRWRFGSFEEVAALAGSAVTVSVALFFISRFAFNPRLLPISVSVGAGLAAVLGMATVRYGWRLAIGRRLRPDSQKATRVLVFGAGEAGDLLVASMLRNPGSPMLPVAFLDDDPTKQKLRIKGLKVVGGRDDFAEAAERFDARRLVIAAPSADPQLLRQLSELAIDAGLDVAVLPAVEQLLTKNMGPVSVADVRPLSVRDLLGRAPVETDIEQVAGYIKGRRVLVTGAGGSIGTELCRQLNRLEPAELVMLDRDESGLHKVQLELEGRALLSSPNLVVADIRDRPRMERVFAEHRPEVVFHAAALKHLPLLQMHPEEAIKTNIRGTNNLLEVAADTGVDRFVNISTDKAADPSSVLGYSKRIAELLTAHTARRTRGTFLSVRFGNVLGSRGSVLETFHSQIAAGGPVTVVDPEVTRYFMTVEEAVELVIQAGAIGHDGEALVLDMGEPVRIDHVARQLISHADLPINIEYTGLRPGEKMHEVLFGPGEIGVCVSHPQISHVTVPPLAPRDLDFDEGQDSDLLIRQLALVCEQRTKHPQAASPTR